MQKEPTRKLFRNIVCEIEKKRLGLTLPLLKLLTIFSFSLFCYSGFCLEIKGMGIYSTDSVHRGAIYWPGHVFKLFPTVTFKNKRYNIRGPGFFYKALLENPSFDLDIGGRYFNDNLSLALYKKDHNYDYMNQRSASLEGFVKFKYSFGFRKLFTTQIKIGKDFIDYKGLYAEVGAGMPILPYTKLKGKMSFAQRPTNNYLYGADAVGGLGYGALEVISFLSSKTKKTMYMISMKQYWILKKVNGSADYIRGREQHLIGALRVIFPLGL